MLNQHLVFLLCPKVSKTGSKVFWHVTLGQTSDWDKICVHELERCWQVAMQEADLQFVLHTLTCWPMHWLQAVTALQMLAQTHYTAPDAQGNSIARSHTYRPACKVMDKQRSKTQKSRKIASAFFAHFVLYLSCIIYTYFLHMLTWKPLWFSSTSKWVRIRASQPHPFSTNGTHTHAT